MVKIILSLLTLTLTSFGAVSSLSNNGRYLNSSATLTEDGWIKYTYTMQPSNIERRDLSFFEVLFCDEASILSPESTLRFKAELSDMGFKWDSLKGNNNDTVSFSFLSQFAPILGESYFKMGNTVYFDEALVPSCQTIPEVSTLGALALGVLTLLRRKR
jgi:hypothetical protein